MSLFRLLTGRKSRSRIRKQRPERLSYFTSLDRWQITSTARLKARAKAMASHKEVFVTSALIIMIREKMATITVRAFFSVKYFFIVVDLHGGFDVGKYRIDMAFFFACFGGTVDSFD
jgi:hypothetical protein